MLPLGAIFELEIHQMRMRPGQGRGWRKVGGKGRKGGERRMGREGEGSVPHFLFYNLTTVQMHASQF